MESSTLLDAARVACERRRFRQAVALAAQAAKSSPPGEALALQAAFVEAKAWEAAGEDSRALAVLRRTLPHHPEVWELHFQLGCCLGRLRRWGEAVQALQQAGTCADIRQEQAARVAFALGVVHASAGNCACAADAYERAGVLDPGLTEAPHQLAACLVRLGSPRRTLERLAALLSADDPAQGLQLADILLVRGFYKEALDVLRRVERRVGITQETAWFRGYALFMLGRCAAARIAFERLTPRSDYYSESVRWRLHAAWAEDDWPEATRLLRLLPHVPGMPGAVRRLYVTVHRLLVDGGGFATIAGTARAAEQMGRALLTMLHAFWTIGRTDLAERLLLLLPLLQWPAGTREAGLLALGLGLELRGQRHERRRQRLLLIAQRLLAQVEPGDAAVQMGQARLDVALGRGGAAVQVMSQAAERTWEHFGVWAQALHQQARALRRIPSRRRVCDAAEPVHDREG